MAGYVDLDKVLEVIINTPSMVAAKHNFDEEVFTALADRQNEIIDLLSIVPTEDVVPVVRCKDCAFITYRYGPRPECAFLGIRCGENDFCSAGTKEKDL